MRGATQVSAAILLSVMLVMPVSAQDLDALGPWKSVPLQDRARWQTIASSPSRPGRLLAAGGGVFRSENSGDSWVTADAGLPSDIGISILTGSAANPDCFYAAAGSRFMYRTTNAGMSWFAVTAPPGDKPIAALFADRIDPHEVWAGSAVGNIAKIWSSTSGGLSWVERSGGLSGKQVFALAGHPDDATTLLAGTDQSIARTTDGGGSWSSVFSGGASEIDWVTPDVVRARRSGPGILESTDSGATWRNLSSIDATAIASNPSNLDVLFAGGGVTGCYYGYGFQYSLQRSSNRGASWSPVIQDPCHWDAYPTPFVYLDVDPAVPSRVSAALSGSDLLRSDVGGASGSWVSKSNGVHRLDVMHVRVGAGDRWFARVADDQQLFTTTDAGVQWSGSRVAGCGWISSFEVSPFVPGLVHEAGDDWCPPPPPGVCATHCAYVRRSVDGGQGWLPEDYSLPGCEFFNESLVRSGGDGQTVYAWDVDWDDRAVLYRSVDGWQTADCIASQTFQPFDAVVHPANGLIAFAACAGRDPVRLTTDGGTTWTARASGLPASGKPVRLLMNPTDSDHLLLVFESRGVFETRDAGMSWAPVPMRLEPPPGLRAELSRREAPYPKAVDAAWDVSAAGRRVFLATNWGVVIEGHGFVNEGLPSVRATSIDYSRVSQKLLVGTHVGAFVLDVPALGGPSAAQANLAGATGTPSQLGTPFSLRGAPNPFTTSTSIRFTSPVGGVPASLDIVDPAGRKVRAFDLAATRGGANEWAWDGCDESGRPVAAGVYFLKLEVAGERHSRSIVKLR